MTFASSSPTCPATESVSFQYGHRPSAAPDDIYRKPRSAFVADFIGRSNLLRGIVSAEPGRSMADRSNQFDHGEGGIGQL
jgi:ABC-type sulfate/molybdate transport systems ATPase subunit